MTIQGKKQTISIKISIETFDLLKRFKSDKDPDFNRSEYIEDLIIGNLCDGNEDE